MSFNISAAFDAASHVTIVQLLEDEFGISGLCRRWIATYLTGLVSAENVALPASLPVDATCGVHRDSILGLKNSS